MLQELLSQVQELYLDDHLQWEVIKKIHATYVDFMNKLEASKQDATDYKDAMEAAKRASDDWGVSVYLAFAPSNVLSILKHVTLNHDVVAAGKVYGQILATRFELYQIQMAAQAHTHNKVDQISVDYTTELHAQLQEYGKFHTPGFHNFEYPDCNKNEGDCHGECRWINNGCFRVDTPSYRVSCGGHSAYSCGDCGPDPTWCNGDCKWLDVNGGAGCFAKATEDNSVWCGGTAAYSCQDCGPVKEWCNGDCNWIDVYDTHGCYRKADSENQKWCGGVAAYSCAECGPNPLYCNGDCIWLSMPGGDVGPGHDTSPGACIERPQDPNFKVANISTILI